MNIMQEAVFKLLSSAKNTLDTTSMQVADLVRFMNNLGYISINGVDDFSRGAEQLKNKNLPHQLSFSECLGIYNKSHSLQPSLETPYVTYNYFNMSADSVACLVEGVDTTTRTISQVYAERLFVSLSLCKNKKKKLMKANTPYVRINNETFKTFYIDIETIGLIDNLNYCDNIPIEEVLTLKYESEGYLNG